MYRKEKCVSGEMCSRVNIRSGKCPVGETSSQGNSCSDKCLVREMPSWESVGWGIVQSGMCQSGKSWLGKCPVGEVSRQQFIRSKHVRDQKFVLKFVTCLQIFLFLNKRSIVHVCRSRQGVVQRMWEGGGGHKIGHFLRLS